jgi:hypothetical protein
VFSPPYEYEKNSLRGRLFTNTGLDAYNCEITNDKEPASNQVYNFSTSDGFITNGRLKASGNQVQENYAKQFQGDGNLQLLGDWFYHNDAQIGDEIEIKFINPTDILLAKI